MKRMRLNKVLRDCTVLQRDKQNRVTKVRVLGSTSWYQVIIRRDGRMLLVECRQDLGEFGYRPCPASENWHMCYHARHALMVAANAAGKQLAFFRVLPHTDGLTSIGKAMFPVVLWGDSDKKVREWVQVRVSTKGAVLP